MKVSSLKNVSELRMVAPQRVLRRGDRSNHGWRWRANEWILVRVARLDFHVSSIGSFIHLNEISQ